MIRFWRIPSAVSETVAALLCALVLLSGVVQARAGTEFSAKTGFANALTLCQQQGSAGNGPEPDSNCDHCRMPMPLATSTPAASFICARWATGVEVVTPTPAGHISGRAILPEARGPPDWA